MRISQKAGQFTESVIREMTRLAAHHDAINLAQGFPNFAAPATVKDAACAAIQADINQYAITWGSRDFRTAIAEKYRRTYGFQVDPETEVTVACGATECMIAALLAVLDPGQRVLVFEPFYENYGPDSVIAGADPVFFSLDQGEEWRIDFDELERVLGREPIRAMILNTPHNPTGKVFRRDELAQIAQLAERYDFFILTDEIYEHIIYDGLTHHLIAALPGMRERTITISGLSKTFSVTGWRLGYLIAPPDISSAIRKMHDFLTVGAAAPLQRAGAAALDMPAQYFEAMTTQYTQRREFMVAVLERSGFGVWAPQGAYYIMADFSGLSSLDDVSFVREMIVQHGVATVPGSSFYQSAERGRTLVRFAFCKTMDLLEAAAERLIAIAH